jgi:hypothetical protein
MRCCRRQPIYMTAAGRRQAARDEPGCKQVGVLWSPLMKVPRQHACTITETRFKFIPAPPTQM